MSSRNQRGTARRGLCAIAVAVTALLSAVAVHVGPPECFTMRFLRRRPGRPGGRTDPSCRAVARVDLHALGVADQERLLPAGGMMFAGTAGGARRGVGHLRHGQGRCGHGEAYAHGAAETGKSGHSSINSEKQVGTGSVHATGTGQLRGSEVLAMVARVCADCGRWAASRGERGLGGTNAGYSLIPVWPDCAASPRVPTTSGSVSICLR